MVEPFRQSFIKETYIHINSTSSYRSLRITAATMRLSMGSLRITATTVRLSKQLKNSVFPCTQHKRTEQSKNLHLRYNFTDWLEMPVNLFIRLLSKQRQ